MKVGIITQYYKSKNLGGLLQSYAVVKIVQSIGFECEQICYDLSVNNTKSNAYRILRRFHLMSLTEVKALITRVIFKFSKKKHNGESDSLINILNLQNKVFEEFESFIPHSSTVYNINTVNEIENKYERYITGSDQVWHPALFQHKAFFLTFTDEKKNKIAFSVSMGKGKLTRIESILFKRNIRGLDSISVREESLAKLIKSTSNKNPSVVLDPTLLLNPEQWSEIQNRNILPKRNYVFCYFLGDCLWQRKIVKKYAADRGYLIIDLPYIMGSFRKSDQVLDSESHYDVGPREFLSLIANAECVFTDSFHAMAFSINFNREFYVFDRNGLTGPNSMNSRITDFLTILSLSKRRITSESEKLSVEKIPWDYVNGLLVKERYNTIEWLNSKLQS